MLKQREAATERGEKRGVEEDIETRRSPETHRDMQRHKKGTERHRKRQRGMGRGLKGREIP